MNSSAKKERDYLFLLPVHLRSQSVLDQPAGANMGSKGPDDE